MISRTCITLVFALMVTAVTLQSGAVYAATAGPNEILDGDGAYFDTGITINPFDVGGSPGLFGVAGCCVGVQGGTNNVAVTDGDGVEGGADAQSIDFVLDPGFGLAGIDFIFARANPIILSGFTTNPLVSVGNNPNSNITAAYDSGTNSVQIFHPWAGGSITDFTFGNPNASAGQTITLMVADAGDSAPQAAINQVEWLPASLIVPGDVDGDGDVDLVEIGGDGISDFDIIRDNWFNDSSPTREMGDLNGDGIVEFDDFSEWKTEFGVPIAGSMADGFYVVPEAASIVLAGIGLLSFTAVRRRG